MRSAVATLAVLALLVAAGPAAAQSNNNYENGENIELDDFAVGSNVGATIEANEPLTVQRNAWCSPTSGLATPAGWPMRSTLWWWFRGAGRTVTVEAWAPDNNMDPSLAVYLYNGPTLFGGGTLIRCNDDVAPGDEDGLWSAVRIPTQNGRDYDIQVGSACQSGGPVCGSPAGEGRIRVDVMESPRDDDRGTPTRLTLGQPTTQSFSGATEAASGEVLNCGDSPYGKTRWFRVTVPATGTLSVSATSPDHDSVIALYALNAPAPLACNDDDGGSTSTARVDVRVGPGEYEIQVGGYGRGILADAYANLVLTAAFVKSTDVDGDGVHVPLDCDDNNAAIRPGVPEIVNNDVDENCDGIKGQDADRDGHLSVATGGDDCNDGNPAIHPGMPEINGNKVDENCDKIIGKYTRVRAQPKFRYVFEKGPPRLKVVQIWVEDAEATTRLTLKCAGKGCPAKRTLTKTVSKRAAMTRLNMRISKRLQKSASLTLTITRSNEIGVVRKVVVKARGVEDRTLCLTPGAKKAKKCS